MGQTTFLAPSRTCSLISKEENDAILARKEEVLKDQALLEAIADRTGVYIDHEVRGHTARLAPVTRPAEDRNASTAWWCNAAWQPIDRGAANLLLQVRLLERQSCC